METKQDFKRESAKRIFAREFNMTRYDVKFDESDDKSPTFIITPTGALASRVLISGIMTSKERKTDKNVLYTGLLNDNTGNFRVTASHFNPVSQQNFAAIKDVPVFVTVIGKPSMYKREDNKVFLSVRIEDIVVTDKLTRDLWILDTAKATYNRIALLEEGDDEFMKDVKAKYNTDCNTFRAIAKSAVDAIVE
jgi:RPA family protein